MVVGLLGRKGSGKSTVAKIFIEQRCFVEVSFANRLKKLAIELFNLSYSQVYGTIEEKETVDPRYNKTPREIMQHIGGSMREIHNGVWIDSLLASIKYDSVISDVRHINEAEAIRKKGGLVVKIVRPGFDTGAYNDHPSETEVDQCEYDHIFYNDGTIEDLSMKVELLLAKYHPREHADESAFGQDT